MSQIPHGPTDLYCPLWKKAMAKVCHTCPLYIQLRGKNPNTGAEVDNWGCSLSHLPMLLVENAQQTRQNGAATESLRNELIRVSENTIAAAETFQAVHAHRKPQVIEINPRKEN